MPGAGLGPLLPSGGQGVERSAAQPEGVLGKLAQLSFIFQLRAEGARPSPRPLGKFAADLASEPEKPRYFPGNVGKEKK